MQYQAAPFDANFQSDFVQSATAPGLELATESLLNDLVAKQRRVVGIDMDGAGDGHTFVVRVDHIPATLQNPPIDFEVHCYEAANEQTLKLAFAAIPPEPGAQVIDQIIGGASQGTRFMGLLVLAPGAGPVVGLQIGGGIGVFSNSPVQTPDGFLSANLAGLIADPGNSLFSLTGGQLVYNGTAVVRALVTMEYDAFSIAGAGDVLFEVYQGATVRASTVMGAGAGNNEAGNASVVLILNPGDTLDTKISAPLSFIRYHLAACALGS